MHYSIRHGTASAFPQTFRYPPNQGYAFSTCPQCRREIVASYVPDRLPVGEGSKWPDILTGPWPLIVTERVANEFQKAHFTGFSVESVDVIACTEKLSLTQMPKYVGLRVDPWGIKCNPKKTSGNYHFGPPTKTLTEYPDLCVSCGVFPDLTTPTIKSIELDMSTWNGMDFSSWNMYVFVTESVVRLSLEKKFTSFHFTNPAEAWDVTAKSMVKLPK